MKKDTLHAKEILKTSKNCHGKCPSDALSNGEYTCVLCKGDVVYTSKETGIKPLMKWLDEKNDLKGFCAADKIVGRAAAFLYILMGVSEVYAGVMTTEAEELLKSYGISAYCTTSTDKIINRTGTDICPMEKTVKDVTTPEMAYKMLKKRTVAL